MRQPQLAQGQENEKFIGCEKPFALLEPRLFGEPSNPVFFNPANTRGISLMLTALGIPAGEPGRDTPVPSQWLTF